MEGRKAGVLISLENCDDGEICCVGSTPIPSSKKLILCILNAHWLRRIDLLSVG